MRRRALAGVLSLGLAVACAGGEGSPSGGGAEMDAAAGGTSSGGVSSGGSSSGGASSGGSSSGGSSSGGASSGGASSGGSSSGGASSGGAGGNVSGQDAGGGGTDGGAGSGGAGGTVADAGGDAAAATGGAGAGGGTADASAAEAGGDAAPTVDGGDACADASVVCGNADGCCPVGCHPSVDADCPAVCGDFWVSGDETCDADCPTECDDFDPCTVDVLAGDPGNCDVTCTSTPIDICTGGDGCCSEACNLNTDSDCGTRCGDGIVSGDETCEGDCPESCDDGDPCTTDVKSGGAQWCNVKCEHLHIDPTCDGVDDDCDGSFDEDFAPQAISCGVGYCFQGAALQTCAPGGKLEDSCPPPKAPLGPDTTCDGVDDDCDNMIDEEYVPKLVSCGLGVCDVEAMTLCLNGQESPPWMHGACPYPSTEVCNGLDDDCNGSTDEGLTCP